jgi:hypothetical protein
MGGGGGLKLGGGGGLKLDDGEDSTTPETISVLASCFSLILLAQLELPLFD